MRDGLAGPDSGMFGQLGLESAFAEFKRLDRLFNMKSGNNPYGDLLFRFDCKGYQGGALNSAGNFKARGAMTPGQA